MQPPATAPAASASSAPAATSESRPAQTPTAQLAPAFVALGAPPNSAAPQRLLIRLDPAELGKVQVRIERPVNGPARVQLAVERPETLLTLMQDGHNLNHALDLAGIPPEGRTIQFSLTPPDSGQTSSGGNPSGSGPGNEGNGTGGNPGGRARQDGADDSDRQRPRTAWQRAGIDITA